MRLRADATVWTHIIVLQVWRMLHHWDSLSKLLVSLLRIHFVEEKATRVLPAVAEGTCI